MHVFVVESPAKTRPIRSYLGTGHEVIATWGHMQGLEAKDGSVDPARNFAIMYATRHRVLDAFTTALEETDALGARHRSQPRGRGHRLAGARFAARAGLLLRLRCFIGCGGF